MWVWKRISKFGKIQKSFLTKRKNGDAKSDTNAVYVKAHNKKRLGPRGFGGKFQKSARSKLISSCHLQDDMWYYGIVLNTKLHDACIACHQVFKKSFRGTCVDGCTKPSTTFFYVNTYNASGSVPDVSSI